MSERDNQNNQKNPPARGWGFTVHPEKFPAEWSLERYLEHLRGLPWLRYFLISLETGGKEGKEHLQGYCEHQSKISRFNAVFSDLMLGTSGEQLIGWVFARRGTLQEMRDYIMHEGNHKKKEGDLIQVWEHGEPHSVKSDNSASDYSLLLADLQAGKSDLELMEEYPWLYVRYYHNISRLRDLLRSEIPLQMIKQRIQEGRE